jgi:hypothetical protein
MPFLFHSWRSLFCRGDEGLCTLGLPFGSRLGLLRVP